MESEWSEFGYEKMYRVNRCGVVQSKLHPRGGRFAINRITEWRDLKQYSQKTDKYGGYYPVVNLKVSSSPSKFKTVRVHRIVAENFLGKIGKGMEIDHIDGNRNNNKLSNLRIVTHKENIKSACDRNAWGSGKTVGSKKITIEILREIKKMIREGKGNAFIADVYKVDRSNISRIRTGKWHALKYLKDD